MNLLEKISSRPILTRVARSQYTRHYGSITRHTTSRDVQTLSTSARGPISWLPLPTTIAPILITTADLSTSSQSPSTTKAQSKLSAGLGDKRFKSSGYVGLNGTLPIRTGSLIFASHGCSSLNRAAQPTGIALSRRLMSCALLIQSLPSGGTSWIPSPVLRALTQSGSLKTTGTITM